MGQEEKDICSRIVDLVKEKLPKESMMRRGRVHNLALGEMSIVDTTMPMLYLDNNGLPYLSEESYDPAGIPSRVSLPETPIVIRSKIHYSNHHGEASAHKIALQLVDKLVRAENDLLLRLLEGCTFVPKRDYFRVRKFFRDLGRPALVVPEESMEKFIPRVLTTWVRQDVTASWSNSPNSIAIDYTLWESVSPTLVDRAWIPGIEPWTV